MKPSRFVAKFDAGTVTLRALARFLHGKDNPQLGQRGPLTYLISFANLLPPSLRNRLYALGGWWESVPPSKLDNFPAEDISRWVVDQYPRRPYPALMVGSANGAATHLCCALGIPWLPQTFLLPVRWSGIHPDDFQRSLEVMKEPAAALLRHNPEVQVHHMHDPNQDRLMIRHMAYFRVKRRSLGATYTRFISETLAPGGTLILVECRQGWPTRQVAERHFFQAGGWGGADPEEYLHGSPQVEEFLRRESSPWQTWQAPEPDAQRPEAEWGFEPALGEDAERLAKRQGYRLCRLTFTDAQDLSPLVADLYRWWNRQRNIPNNRLVVSSLMLLEPWWTIRTGSVPYWCVISVERSAAILEKYLRQAEPYDDIGLMMFTSGVEGVGLGSLQRWQELLRRYARRRGFFVGVNEQAYPKDFAAFIRYHQDMKKLQPTFPMPESLTLPQFEQFMRGASQDYGVEWIG